MTLCVRLQMRLSKIPQSDRAARTNAIIDFYAEEARIKRIKDQAVDLLIKRESDADPIDQRLRAIVAANKNDKPFAHGMMGGLQLFARLNDPKHYKAKAAENLLEARHVHRWHKYHRGIVHRSHDYPARAAHCRDLAFKLSQGKQNA